MRAHHGKGVRVLYDIVREGPELGPCSDVRAAGHVVQHYRAMQESGRIPREREAFAILMLNARHKTIGFYLVSIGTLNSSAVHPREIFRAAIAVGAARIVLAHHHPSGDSSPSPEDREVTKRLTECGELLGITVLDHVVIGDRNYYSFADGRSIPLPGGELDT